MRTNGRGSRNKTIKNVVVEAGVYIFICKYLGAGFLIKYTRTLFDDVDVKDVMMALVMMMTVASWMIVDPLYSYVVVVVMDC